MPWRETCVMDERMKLVSACLDGEQSLSALCRRYGVSRKTGYKWLSRYGEEGPAGLEDRSRSPHNHPQAVSAELVERILAARGRYPSWGPKKLRAWLESHHPEERWPAQSTIGVILERAAARRE